MKNSKKPSELKCGVLKVIEKGYWWKYLGNTISIITCA